MLQIVGIFERQNLMSSALVTIPQARRVNRFLGAGRDVKIVAGYPAST